MTPKSILSKSHRRHKMAQVKPHATCEHRVAERYHTAMPGRFCIGRTSFRTPWLYNATLALRAQRGKARRDGRKNGGDTGRSRPGQRSPHRGNSSALPGGTAGGDASRRNRNCRFIRAAPRTQRCHFPPGTATALPRTVTGPRTELCGTAAADGTGRDRRCHRTTGPSTGNAQLSGGGREGGSTAVPRENGAFASGIPNGCRTAPSPGRTCGTQRGFGRAPVDTAVRLSLRAPTGEARGETASWRSVPGEGPTRSSRRRCPTARAAPRGRTPPPGPWDTPASPLTWFLSNCSLSASRLCPARRLSTRAGTLLMLFMAAQRTRRSTHRAHRAPSAPAPPAAPPGRAPQRPPVSAPVPAGSGRLHPPAAPVGCPLLSAFAGSSTPTPR